MTLMARINTIKNKLTLPLAKIISSIRVIRAIRG
jgi:hypothetical protein